MKALIAGGGIGGLTAALFLHRAGVDVEVYERTDDIRELGVGINLLPHAVRELSVLGLQPELDAAGIRLGELRYANRLGQVVWQEARGVDAGHDHPQISIHRGRLLGLIYGAVVERLGASAVRTGHRVLSVHQTDRQVEVEIQCRDGMRSIIEADLLIGADGIHSTIRSQFYPDEGAPIWNGVMLWRGCTDWPTWRDGRTMMVAGGNFAKFVFYPIAKHPERGDLHLTNWAVMAKTGEEGRSPPRPEDWSRPGVREEALSFVRNTFRLTGIDPAAIIMATPNVYEYPNCDRHPLARWSFGRVTLLGDAAHPMYPVGSNGASQAILDASTLAACLESTSPIQAALEAYDAQRRPATAKIILANRQGGPERVIDMVEARAPHGFSDIDAVATVEEREAIVRGYAKLSPVRGKTQR